MKYLILLMIVFTSSNSFAAQPRVSKDGKALDSGNGVCAICKSDAGPNCVWDLMRADLGCNSPCTYESFPCDGSKRFVGIMNNGGVPGYNIKRTLGIMPTFTPVAISKGIASKPKTVGTAAITNNVVAAQPKAITTVNTVNTVVPAGTTAVQADQRGFLRLKVEPK